MKKLNLQILTIMVALISIMSCSNPVADEPATSFYGELGRISTIDYNSVVATIPVKSSYTFDEIYNYRWQFREKTQYDFSSSPGGTRDDIYELLTTRGYTPSEANTIIDSIINTGNVLLFFNYAYSEDYKIWMYIEME